MLTVGELVGYLDLDGTKFEKGIDAAKRSFDSLDSTIAKAGKGMLGSLDKFGGKVNKVIMDGLTAGLATGMAAIGVVIAKGFSRLKAIDDARSKLQGLGHDAKTVEVVMKNALDSVLGTSFGLDEAATTAAIALASGVKPGQDLERTLRLTADAAAIAKVGMAEMSDIFGTVAAANRLTMLEVRRLAQHGIPMLQWLAEEYGVTAAEAKKMVADGEVDFERFRNAIEKNIGGAALEMGDSWSGAFANMGHAASRLGAALLGPIFQQMKGWFHAVIGLLDDLTAKAGPWAEEFSERVSDALHDIRDGFIAARGGANSFMGIFERIGGLAAQVVGWVGNVRSALLEVKAGFDAAQGGATGFLGPFERLGGLLSDVYDWLKENREIVEAVGRAMAIAAPIVLALASAVNIAGKAFALLVTYSPVGMLFAFVAALTYAWQNSETFRDIVGQAFTVLQDLLVNTVWPAIQGAIQGFIDWLGSPAGQGLINGLLDLIGQGAKLLQTIFEGVWPIIQSVVQGFIDFFNSPAGSALIQTLLSAIGTVLTILQQAFETVWPIIQQVVQTFIDFWNGETGQKLVVALMKGIELALRVLEDVFNAVWPIIELVVQEFIDFFESPEGQWLIESLVDLLSAAVEHLGKIWEEIWPAMEVALKVVAVMISNNLKVLEGAIWLVVHALQKLKDLYEWLKKSGAFSLSGGQTGPSGGGGFQARAAGGLITRPELALIGEAGPELLLPLSRPARTQQLLSRAGLVGSDPAPSVTITGPISIYINGQGREAGEAAADGFLQRLAIAGVTV